MTVEEAHKTILSSAVQIANQTVGSEPPFQGFGDIFRAQPEASESGGLCLLLEESVTASLSAEDVQRLHEVGVNSVQQALIQNSDLWVGTVIGLGKQGTNYFDRFS